MTVAREAYHHGDLRRAVLDAAVALVAEVGPDGFSLRELARRVGVNHRALYRHFEDRRAVLAALAQDGWERYVAEASAEAAVAEGTVEKLYAVASCYARFARVEAARFKVMSGPRLNEDNRFPELERAIASAWGLLREILGPEGHRLPIPVDDAAITVWTAMHGYAILVQQRRLAVRPDRMEGHLRMTFGVTLAGLGLVEVRPDPGHGAHIPFSRSP